MADLGTTLKWSRQALGGAFTLINQNSSAANQWFGKAQVFSQSNVVSTALVSSASYIFVSFKSESPVGSNGTDVPLFGVTSISDGGFFLIGTIGSVAIVGSYSAFWELKNPKA